MHGTALSTLFDLEAFLETAGIGRRIVVLKAKQAFFSQGDPADSIYYLRKGRAKVTIVSHEGKEATITLLAPRDFLGEESLASVGGRRLTSAIALTACTATRIERDEMVRAMHNEHEFSDLFVKYLLMRGIRTQADLVDQLFNSSEKRLARVLLLMAQFGKEGVSDMVVPRLSQETLAEMVGTTRSRVNFFMNRFRKLGFINYDTGNNLQVHSSLLTVVLNDSNEQTRESSAPPAERGGPRDKERARRPRLPGSA